MLSTAGNMVTTQLLVAVAMLPAVINSDYTVTDGIGVLLCTCPCVLNLANKPPGQSWILEFYADILLFPLSKSVKFDLCMRVEETVLAGHYVK